MIEVDIVVPVYKKLEEIKKFFSMLPTQEGVKINKIVTPFTLCGNDEFDNQIREVLKENNAVWFEMDQTEFSHSMTREKAIRDFCECEIVVLMSQDVVLCKKNSIYNLVKNINDEVVYVYGKQICTNNTIEKYIRAKNYGVENIIIDASMVEKMQLMAFFASDAFSALNRDIFIKLNGYQGYEVMMNEDQLYSKIIIDGGYKKMYVADAVVEHSHKYKLKQLYHRYYQTGQFYKQVKIFDDYKSTDSGFALALYILKEALKHLDIPVLLRWLPDMAARYLGMRKGRKYIEKEINK